MPWKQLPEGLAEMPPGPELAAALAQIDPTTLNGHDLVSLSAVYAKQVSHYQAGMATVLDQVVRRLPQVHAQLAAGMLDQPRARAFVDGLASLEPRSAHAVANQLLARGAASLDVRTLTERLRRRAIAHDPPSVARRYAQRLSERRVQTRPHPDGTADLHG